MLFIVFASAGLSAQSAHTGYEALKKEPVAPARVQSYYQDSYELLSGGPDGFGYMYYSTQDGDAEVTFNWIDISTTGTALGAGDDWCSGSSASTLYYLGFSFPYYDQVKDSISICSNGTIVLENPYDYQGLSNAALPDSGYGPNGFIAVMWDDINPADASADDIYFQAFSTCPDGYSGACAVIQYHNVPRYGGSVYMNFEVILYDNGDIKLQYNSAIDYTDATIGIQDSTAAVGINPNWYLEYVYNGNPSTHIPDSGTAILFKYPPPIDYDVAVLNISPAGPVPVDTIIVEATLRNNGSIDLTGVPVTLTIYDTATSNVVFTSSTNADIAAQSIITVSFDPFLPDPRKVYELEVAVAEPQDTIPGNDTLRVLIRTALAFGDIVGSWDFPSLGDGGGYSFAGITYASDSGKFYVVSMNPMSTVFEFDPNDPAATFTQTSWTLHAFFGANDIPWGIAYGPGGFYVTHVGYDGSTFVGCMIGYYDGSGNLYDSLDVYANIEAGGWLAGLDWDADNGYLWGIYVGGSNSVYQIDVTNKTVAGTFPNVTSYSLRGISVFREVDRVLYGGWNQGAIYLLDYSGNQEASVPMLGMADVDVWMECNNPDDPIYAFITLNNSTNTLVKMATGFYCDQVAVSEKPGVNNDIRLTINGRTVHLNVDDIAEVYSISGRKLGQFRGTTTISRTGLYIIKVRDRSFKVIIK